MSDKENSIAAYEKAKESEYTGRGEE